MRKVLKTAIARAAGSDQFVERMPEGSLLSQRHKKGRCPRCRAALKVFKLWGRTAYCCPQCQSC
jgi:formamidopyrimidine-DNA glycosylase